jgi:hypothetical protein
VNPSTFRGGCELIRLTTTIPEAIQQFRANPWPYQKTLVTPRKDMARFLSTLLTVFPIDRGVASTDQVVFEPDNVLELLKSRQLSMGNYWTFCLEASKNEDVAALLAAMLSDWIDFVFVPSPTSFAIYADHDEYLTIYAPSSQERDHLVTRLELEGFRFVADYVRPSEGDIWR